MLLIIFLMVSYSVNTVRRCVASACLSVSCMLMSDTIAALCQWDSLSGGLQDIQCVVSNAERLYKPTSCVFVIFSQGPGNIPSVGSVQTLL